MPSDLRYLREDEHGVMRVGPTRVSLDSIIYPFREGHTAETIRQSFPTLTLEQVYGSIAEYLAHREEFDEYLKRQEALWEEVRAKSEKENAALLERLRKHRAQAQVEAR